MILTRTATAILIAIALESVTLAAGATAYSEERSKRNFAFVSHLVVPGDPSRSLLLKHPLSPEADGDEFHSGGRQFANRDDPDFKVIAAWISPASK